MTIDIDRARTETPGCQHVIHLNNAGAALIPATVSETVTDYLDLESRIGGYEAVRERAPQIEAVYDSIAALIGCKRDEIAVVENATRAWDMAFYSLPFNKGDRILTGMSEYASNFIPYLQVAKKTGAVVEVIPNDEHGQVCLESLKAMIDSNVKLISITHIPTNGGLVNPAAGIGRLARENGILFLLDACQSVGQLPIDVNEIGCDMLSTTSRKFLRGPRGMGFLYIRKDLVNDLEPPFLDLHSAKWKSREDYEIRADARRFENWETNYAAKVGLGAAVDYARAWGLDSIWQRTHSLGRELREKLAEIAGVNVLDLGETKCGIVTFSVEGLDAEKIRQRLTEQSINVSVPKLEDTLLDSNQRNLDRFIRASAHYYNTNEELDQLCHVIDQIARS